MCISKRLQESPTSTLAGLFCFVRHLAARDADARKAQSRHDLGSRALDAAQISLCACVSVIILCGVPTNALFWW